MKTGLYMKVTLAILIALALASIAYYCVIMLIAGSIRPADS